MTKRTPEPVVVKGGSLVTTWWGRAWVENLETYADEDRRISRGREYLREGRVVDLEIETGIVRGSVAGSRSKPYSVEVRIEPMSEADARGVQDRCSDRLSDAESLLEGRMPLSMEEVLRSPRGGLFPSGQDIDFTCTCPDQARMCKHVAAVLLGVGVRFDSDPSLFFRLRGISTDMFAERSAKGRLDAMLDNADVRTDRMLDDSLIGALFGVVEHKEFKRPAIERRMLETMLGRPLYEEGLALAGSVSDPADIGDGMLKVTVSEPKVKRQHVVIWRDRDGSPVRYACGCDSEGPCRHIAAALVRLFSQDAADAEARKAVEADRIAARISKLDAEWACEDDGYDVLTDQVTELCDSIFETFGYGDPRAVHLFDALYRAIGDGHPGPRTALDSRSPMLSDVVRVMPASELAGMMSGEGVSWLFGFASEIPRGTFEEILNDHRDIVGEDNLAEAAYVLGRYDEYISIKGNGADGMMRCLKSAVASGREDDASRFASMLSLADLSDQERGDADALLRSLGMGGLKTGTAMSEFLRRPSDRTLEAAEDEQGWSEERLVDRAWAETVSRRVPTPEELRFFLDKGKGEEVDEYIIHGGCAGILTRGCDLGEVGWLFNVLMYLGYFESAAALGRGAVEIALNDWRLYGLGAQILWAMDNNRGFEKVRVPHSEYMDDLRGRYGSRRKFWSAFEG